MKRPNIYSCVKWRILIVLSFIKTWYRLTWSSGYLFHLRHCYSNVWKIRFMIEFWSDSKRIFETRKTREISHLLRFVLEPVEDEGLVCQFLFLWLMNQLFICFNWSPVSWTNLALSSSWKYIHESNMISIHGRYNCPAISRFGIWILN